MEGTLVGGAVHLPNLYALPDHTIALSDPKKLSKYLDIYRVLAQGTFPAFQKKWRLVIQYWMGMRPAFLRIGAFPRITRSSRPKPSRIWVELIDMVQFVDFVWKLKL